MFAVGASDHSFLADLHAIGYKCALYNSAGFDLDARHQYTVDDLGAFANLDSGKQDRVLNLALNDTSLCDEGALDACLRSYIVRQGGYILRVDLPGRLINKKKKQSEAHRVV